MTDKAHAQKTDNRNDPAQSDQMRRLLILGTMLASLTGTEDPVSHLVAQAERWYSAKPTDRTLDEARALVDACILEQRHLPPSQSAQVDTALHTVLLQLATEGPQSVDTFVVNTCDHLLLRYGDDHIRYQAVLQILYAEPATLGSWTREERKAHLLRRTPVLGALWSRINAGARDKLPPDQLPLLNIARPSDPNLTNEERAQAWERYFQARDLNDQRARHAVRQAGFQNAKDGGSEDLQAWLRTRCLPDDVGFMRGFLSAAGFYANEIVAMIGHPGQ